MKALIIFVSAVLVSLSQAQAADSVRAFYFGNSLTGATNPDWHEDLGKSAGKQWQNAAWLGAGWHYTAVRSMEIFKIWEDVFGSHTRFVRVLPSQSGVGSVSEGVLGFRDAAKHADALATAPYMSYSIGRGKNADLGGQMKDWTVDQMLDHFEKTGFADSLQRMAKDKTVADKYGVKLIAYEGGQHMVAFLRDQALVKQISATMHACNRHPRMGEMYRRYYDEWAKLGGDVFAVFSSIGAYSNHGAWGLAEFNDSKPADYPKLRATLEWAKQHGQPVEMD